jgi:hypothetical protein
MFRSRRKPHSSFVNEEKRQRRVALRVDVLLGTIACYVTAQIGSGREVTQRVINLTFAPFRSIGGRYSSELSLQCFLHLPMFTFKSERYCPFVDSACQPLEKDLYPLVDFTREKHLPGHG